MKTRGFVVIMFAVAIGFAPQLLILQAQRQAGILPS